MISALSAANLVKVPLAPTWQLLERRSAGTLFNGLRVDLSHCDALLEMFSAGGTGAAPFTTNTWFFYQALFHLWDSNTTL